MKKPLENDEDVFVWETVLLDNKSLPAAILYVRNVKTQDWSSTQLGIYVTKRVVEKRFENIITLKWKQPIRKSPKPSLIG